MPNYKLIYFGARGKAEVIRLIFAEVNAKYEDVRIGGEEWCKLKPSIEQIFSHFIEIFKTVLQICHLVKYRFWILMDN